MEFKPSNMDSTDINVDKNLWISPWQSNMETAHSTRAQNYRNQLLTASTPPGGGSTMYDVPNRVYL